MARGFPSIIIRMPTVSSERPLILFEACETIANPSKGPDRKYLKSVYGHEHVHVNDHGFLG